MAQKTIEIPVTGLEKGMLFVSGKEIHKVETITGCPQTQYKGIKRIHVNDKYCFDTIGKLEVLIKGLIAYTME